jgi:hypothetical protein
VVRRKDLERDLQRGAAHVERSDGPRRVRLRRRVQLAQDVVDGEPLVDALILAAYNLLSAWPEMFRNGEHNVPKC